MTAGPGELDALEFFGLLFRKESYLMLLCACMMEKVFSERIEPALEGFGQALERLSVN